MKILISFPINKLIKREQEEEEIRIPVNTITDLN